MPKINNVEFLTLPQQVGKNKKDISVLNQNVGSLQGQVNNIEVGISNIPIVKDVAITALNSPVPLSGGNQAIVLNALKQQYDVHGESKSISWALNINVLGSLVGDNAFPGEIIGYDISFANITYNDIVGGKFYRARGFSRDFTFVLEATIHIDNNGDWTFSMTPTVTMMTIQQPSTYYAEVSNIVGNVVALANLVPLGMWVKIGDLVIAGSGVYKVDSLSGVNANLSPINTYIAPTGTINNGYKGINTDNVNTLSDTNRIILNKYLGTYILESSTHNDVTILETQLNALGLTMGLSSYCNYQYIGAEVSGTPVGRFGGWLIIKAKNNSGSTITTPSLTNVVTDGASRNTGLSYITSGVVSTDVIPYNYTFSGTLLQRAFMHNLFPDVFGNKTIDDGKSIYLIMYF